MSDEEIRIAVAEACGYEKVVPEPGLPWGASAPAGKYFYIHQLPDYCNDLNACAEMEKTLSVDDAIRYRIRLTANSATDPNRITAEAAMCHATARQRAEAYLRCLGLWKQP